MGKTYMCGIERRNIATNKSLVQILKSLITYHRQFFQIEHGHQIQLYNLKTILI